MSTAAHEPRRVEPRRADSPSGSKVTPRRNAPETSEPNGLQYDSDELPVLIRLPNLREAEPIAAAETRPTSTTQTKRHRVDRASASKQKASKQSSPRVTKKSFQQHASANKLVLGGIVGGVLVVVMLFLFNGSSPTPPAGQDGWASQADGLGALVQEPEISMPIENEAPQLYPGFAYEAPDSGTAQFAAGQLEQTPIGVPYSGESQVPAGFEAAAFPSKPQTAVGWPSDEAMGSQSNPGSTPANLWPDAGLSLERGGYGYPTTDSHDQTDFRSSMYPPEAESYRMGKLESDRQSATQGGSSSILNGNIEIPDTTSIR